MRQNSVRLLKSGGVKNVLVTNLIVTKLSYTVDAVSAYYNNNESLCLKEIITFVLG